MIEKYRRDSTKDKTKIIYITGNEEARTSMMSVVTKHPY